MKMEFYVEKKKANIEGREVEYFVLKKELIDKSILEIPIKKEKAQVLMMNEYASKKDN